LHFSKSTPFGHLLFEKSKSQPFETFTRAQEIKRWQRNLHAMDSIPENRNVSRELKGVLILERWMSYGPWGRNRESASGSTFFSLEEGSNFVQNSRQMRINHHTAGVVFLF